MSIKKITLVISTCVVSIVSAANYELDEFIDVLIQVESKGNQYAFNKKEKARGVLQIRPIMIKDINRILGNKIYNPKDVYSPFTSRQIAKIYFNHYGNIYVKKYGKPLTYEVLARMWCGGPTGYKKWQTRKYWKRFKNFYFINK